MILHKADYGVIKGIPTTLIAAASFDDIIAITIFSVFLSVGMNGAPKALVDTLALDEATDGSAPTTNIGFRLLDTVDQVEEEEHMPIWMEIGFNVL